MRRSDREITDFQEIIEVMHKCKVCHVGLHDDEYPYIVPMNFGMKVDGDNITLYFHGAKVGRKHDLLKKNNKVCFTMEDTHSIVTGPQVGACEATMEFECIMGTGIIEYANDSEKLIGLNAILKQYDIREGNHYHFHDEVVPNVDILCLRINSLSAKRRKVE